MYGSLVSGSTTYSSIKDDKSRKEKGIERLKREITCLHLLFDSKIPVMKTEKHETLMKKALDSKDVEVVRTHHKLMSELVSNYYSSSSGMRLGIVLPVESVFGAQQMAAFPNLIPGLTQGAVQVPKDVPKRDSVRGGEVLVNRGGRNFNAPVLKAIPRRIEQKEYEGKIDTPHFGQNPNAPRARSVYRRGPPENKNVHFKIKH